MTPFDRFVAQLMQQAGRMKSGAAVMAVVALAGCATQQSAPNEGSAAGGTATPPLEVSTEISKVANNINSQLKRLAEVEEASKKVKIAPRPKVTKGPLAERVTIPPYAWPVEEIVSKVAEGAGYGFRTVGTAPAIGLLVKTDFEDMPVIDVLRSIGLKLGDKATVHVDQSNKVVEVIYASDR